MRTIKKGILVLTKKGISQAERLKALYQPFQQADIYYPVSRSKEKSENNNYHYSYQGSLREQVGRLFPEYNQLVFIMALGIVVRVIAPYLKDKRSDPAVVTIDQAGRNIISTLSGHLGGANRLALEIAAALGGNPVITTASELEGQIAFDLLAQMLNCRLIPFANLKQANAAVVNESMVNIFTDHYCSLIKEVLPKGANQKIKIYPLGELEKHQNGFPVIISNRQLPLIYRDYLQLVPRNIVIGIGCRRGVQLKQVETAVTNALAQLCLRKEGIKNLATIELKSDERAISEYAGKLGVPVDLIKQEEIRAADFTYSTSPFVQQAIGVGGVCEPAALLSAKQGRLLLGKTVFNQITIAVVEESGEIDANTKDRISRYSEWGW